MKTAIGTSNLPIPSPRRKAAWSKATLAAMMALTLPPAMEAGPPDTRLAKCEPCIGTARYLHRASLSEALADLNTALANTNNEPTAAARAAGKSQALEDYEDALELAKQQLRERRELCAELDEERYNPVIKPADFLSPAEVSASPNPLFPLVPGTTYHFRAETPEGVETIEFTVTRNTRTILGVTCIVVRDIVKLDGSVIEDTLDWFAQDRSGNVWYFGENVADYEDGLIVSTAGSWEAGVAGAKPGIIMFAQPVVGKFYRQELFLGEAEDAAEVLALNETVTVSAGTYTRCLKTEDFSPLSPDVTEIKYYAPGIGNVLTITPATGKRVELISVVKQ